MNVPAIGLPSPVASAKELILKFETDVVALTSCCLLKPRGCSKSRKIYLFKERKLMIMHGSMHCKHTDGPEIQQAEWAAANLRQGPLHSPGAALRAQ